MAREKKIGFLRKTSSVSSLFCFVSSAICVVILLVLFEDMTKVYRASFASSAFFFFSTGFVLKEIADTKVKRSDLPRPAPGSE